MRMLTFQARRFWWKTFSKTLEEAESVDVEAEARDAVVAYLHLEESDEGEARARVFQHTLKHIKWIANKRGMKRVVLHSFTHLGGKNAAAPFAQAFLVELRERLERTGYAVDITPFGYFCEWSLDVYGDSLAKVYKEIA